MPAARPSSSKSRKSKATSPRSTPKPPPKSPSSQPKGVKRRFECRAWWCESTYTRRADMLRHVSLEHFGKRVYCTICRSVMKQGSNMDTHLNAHFANFCTVCSCGQGFTDPSAYKRHRDAVSHDKGVTHGKARPSIMKGIEVQHLAGVSLTLEMISNRGFVPPLYDESYHLKGMPKPKGQEKYNPTEYLVIERPGTPTIPSTQATGTLLTDGAPAAEYQGPTPAEPPTPAQTEIQVDKLGLHADFSYDMELPQEPQHGQVSTANMCTEYHEPPATYPICHSQPPSDSYYTPPEAIPSDHSYPTAIPHVLTNASVYPPYQYPENYPVANSSYRPLPPQPFAEPYARPADLGTVYPPQASKPPSWSMPPHHNFFEEVGFGMRVNEQLQQHHNQQQQPQPFYHPHAYLYNRAYPAY